MKKHFSNFGDYVEYVREVSKRQYPYICLNCGHEFTISHYTKYRNPKVMKNLECCQCSSKNVIEKVKGVSCGKYR